MRVVGVDPGDVELQTVCESVYPRLVGALSHQVCDPWLAEVLAQEALVRMCQHWSRVRTMNSPLGWAFRVGSNLASTHFRRMAAERRARARLGPAPATHEEADVADRVTVEAALQSLTSRQREVIIARYYLGLTSAQASDILGVSEGAVRALSFRAVGALRELLGVDLQTEDVADVR